MKKKKILFVSPVCSYPIIDGISKILYHRLEELSKDDKYEIYLLILYRNSNDISGLHKYSKFCKNVWIFKISFIHLLKSIFISTMYDRRPFQVILYDDKSLNKKIKLILENNNFLFIDFLTIRTFSKNYLISNSKIILDMIDLLSINFKRRSETTDSPLKRYLYKVESERLKNYEILSIKKAKKIILVSELENALSGVNIHYIENGVDVEKFFPKNKTCSRLKIIFSGNMSYEPNIQAVNWFINNCFSIILKKYDDAQLVICGAFPSKKLKKLNSKSILVTGYVDSIPDMINEAFLTIAPMISGSGMQNKILESMACGIPVITTTLGLGSIKADNDRDIVVRDESDSFAEQVLNLYRDSSKYSKIAASSRNFVINHHSWQNHLKKFIKIIEDYSN